MTIKRFLLLAVPVVLLVFACKRSSELLDENNKWQYVDSTANGYLKVVHAYAPLSPSVVVNTGPKVQVYIDGNRVSRDSTAYNGTFPAPTGAYAVVPVGSHNLMMVLSRANGAAQVAGDTVFRTTVNIAAGKHYTSFLVDTIQNPGVLNVQDNYTVPALGNYQLRYANLVADPASAFDVYSVRQGSNIFSNVTFKQASNFIELPVTTLSDTFVVRRAGTMVLLDTLKAFSATTQRVYTLYTRGKAGVVGRAPATTFYTNR